MAATFSMSTKRSVLPDSRSATIVIAHTSTLSAMMVHSAPSKQTTPGCAGSTPEWCTTPPRIGFVSLL